MEPDLKTTEAVSQTEADVIPIPARVAIATLWVLLFGGRWLLVPLLQYVGVLKPDQVILLDDGPLQKLYLILLSVTLIVLALRTVRDWENRKKHQKTDMP